MTSLKRNTKILVSCLNWGLGHAARSSVILKALTKCDISIASDGFPLQYLRNSFPNLKSYKLPSYGVRYPLSSIVVNLLLQFPKIWHAKNKEQKALRKLQARENFDVVISDNRYGMWSDKTYNIFVLHQLNIIHTNAIIKWIANKVQKKLLHHFDEIWVPDFEDQQLSGDLSNSQQYRSKVKFIGPLSRFKKMDLPIQYHIACSLSGPEPQRAIFEKLLVAQLESLGIKSIIIQGISGDQQIRPYNEHIDIVNHLDTQALNTIFCSTRLLICRSGYSTIMDLYATGAKALLVPTPGQTEQEYLAQHHSNYFEVQSQNEMDLFKAIQRPKKGFGAIDNENKDDLLRKTLERFNSRNKEAFLVGS